MLWHKKHSRAEKFISVTTWTTDRKKWTKNNLNWFWFLKLQVEQFHCNCETTSMDNPLFCIMVWPKQTSCFSQEVNKTVRSDWAYKLSRKLIAESCLPCSVTSVKTFLMTLSAQLLDLWSSFYLRKHGIHVIYYQKSFLPPGKASNWLESGAKTL